MAGFPLSSLHRHNRARYLCGRLPLNSVGPGEIKITVKHFNRLTDSSQPSEIQTGKGNEGYEMSEGRRAVGGRLRDTEVIPLSRVAGHGEVL